MKLIVAYRIVAVFASSLKDKATNECNKGRLTKEFIKWRAPGRRKQGRPKLTWAEGIRGLMGEKGLVEEDLNQWRTEGVFRGFKHH
jgi:hypothetical protein